MSHAASNPHRFVSSLVPAVEPLEERLLLTTLMGGDFFEYIDARENTIRISLQGDIIAEFIAADLSEDGRLFLGDLPGVLYSNGLVQNNGGFRGGSYAGGERLFGGLGGEKGVQLLGEMNTPGMAFEPAGVDEIDVQALATQELTAGGGTYGFNVADEDVQGLDGETNSELRVYLMKIETGNPDPDGITDEDTPPNAHYIEGSTYDITKYLPGDGENEVHSLSLGGAVGGTFTVSFLGETTGPISWDADAATIQAALEGLQSIGPGNIEVTGAGPFTLTFTGDLGFLEIEEEFHPTANFGNLIFASATLEETTQGSGAQNEEHTLAFQGNVTGGTYTISFRGQTTADIAFDADAATLQAALEALATIGAGNISVTGTPAAGFVLEFVNVLGLQDIPLGDHPTVDASALVGADSSGIAEVTNGEDFEPDFEAILGADFRPATGAPEDGLLYFVVQMANEQRLLTVDVAAADVRASIQEVGSVDNADNLITSIAWEKTGSTVTLYGWQEPGNLITIDGTTGFGSALGSGSGSVSGATSITGIEFIQDDPDLPEQYIYAVGTGEDGQIFRIDISDSSAAGFTADFLGFLADPDDEETPTRGESLGGLSWNPLLRNPFTGEFGVLIATDTEADELVYVDYRFRPPTADLFAIYVVQASEDASITIAGVPDVNEDNPGEPRYMEPFESGDGIQITPANGGGGVVVLDPDVGEGYFYLGMRMEGETTDLRPILSANLEFELGVRALGIDDLLSDDDNNLSPGLRGVATLLQYVSGQPALADRLLGHNLDRITEVAVANDGSIFVIDSDAIHERGLDGPVVVGDEIAQVDPITGRAGTPVAIIDGSGSLIGRENGGVQAIDFGNLDPAVFDGQEALYAVINSFTLLPTGSAGTLSGDYNDVTALAKSAGQAVYFVRDLGATYELWRADLDGAGLVTGSQTVGTIAVDGENITGIETLAVDTGNNFYCTGYRGGVQYLFQLNVNTGEAFEVLSLASFGANDVVGLATTYIENQGNAVYFAVDEGASDRLYLSIDGATPIASGFGSNEILVDEDGDGVGDTVAVVDGMDFDVNGVLVAIDRSAGPGTGRLIRFESGMFPSGMTDPASVQLAELSSSSGLSIGLNGLVYTIDADGANNDILRVSSGEQTAIGTLDPTTGIFQSIALLDANIGRVQTMAFAPEVSNTTGVQALFVVDGLGQMWEISMAAGSEGTAINGPVTLVDENGDPIAIDSMDFDQNGRLLAHDRTNGRLVDIEPFNILNVFVCEVANNVATEPGSLRPTLSGISYDAARDRFVVVDNATGNEFLSDENATNLFPDDSEGHTPVVESSVLMELVGTQSDSAQGQNIDRIMLGGIVSGLVDWVGSIDTFYAGWIATGATDGQGEGDPTRPDNFRVTGDLRNLISAGALGGSDDGVTNQPTYVNGFDLQVGGKLGQVWTFEQFLGSIQVENQLDVPSMYSSILQYELEYKPSSSLDNPEGWAFEAFEFYSSDNFFFNDTLDTAQYLGSTLSGPGGVNEIAVLGTLQGQGGLVADDAIVDFYAVSLLAGQTITVQLYDFSSTPISPGVLDVGVYDSDGRLIATDRSDVDPDSVNDMPFRITADRAGTYYFAVGGSPFEGSRLVGASYILYINDAGDLAVGAVRAETSIFNPETSLQIEVERGDFGALFAREQYHSDDQNSQAIDIAVLNGNLRAVMASDFGTSNDTGAFGSGLVFEVPNGSAGLFRAFGAADDTVMIIDSVFVGGDMQWIDCSGNLGLTELVANGGVGTIRAAQWSWINGSPGSITVNADNIGSDGIIDLIDIAGDLGSMTLGGPALITGLGGNVRFMRVGGAIYGDFFFGYNVSQRTQLNPGQSVTLRDDSGGYITLTPAVDNIDPATGQPVLYDDDDNVIAIGAEAMPWLTYRTYGVRGSGGVVLVDVTSTGGLSVTSSSGGINSPVEIGQIIVGGDGRDIVETEEGSGIFELEPDVGSNLNVIITGPTPVDVFEIVGGYFDETEIQNNRNIVMLEEGGNFTSILNNTGGDIIGVVADSIGALTSLGNIGVTGNATGQQILPFMLGGVAMPRVDEARQLAVSYPYGGQTELSPIITTYFGQSTGIVAGDVGVIRAAKGIGNVILFNTGLTSADLRHVIANAGGIVDHTDGEYHGIVAPIYVIGDIGQVQIGEGIAPSGTGLVGWSGLFAQGEIDYITNQGLGSDIHGYVVAARGIRRIVLNDGAFINANVQVFGTDIVLSSDIINDFVAATELGFFKNWLAEATLQIGLGDIVVNGRGGIIGTYFHSGQDIGNITVNGGFGMLNCRVEFDTVTAGGMGNTRVDGFGIRDVNFIGGNNQGDIIATGRGDLASTLDYTETVRYSETYEWDPLFGERIGALNDLHTNLATSAADPFATEGLLVDIWGQAMGSLGNVSGYAIFSGSPVNFAITPWMELDYANSIRSISTIDIIDGLVVTTGSLKTFNPGSDVSGLDMMIAGRINQIVINGSLLGDSQIVANGPNGDIRTVKIAGDMDGDIIAYGLIGSITIGGDLTGNIIVEATNGGRLALSSLKVDGSFGNGSLDINGDVGTIEVLGSLGSPGDTMHIVGDLRTLRVGTDRNVDGSSLVLDIDVVGDLGTVDVYGQVEGNIFVGGSVNRFNVYADAITALAPGNIVNGNVTILGSLGTAMISDGNLNANFTVGESIGTFKIDDGDINAGFTLASSFGDIKTVSIRGDLFGAIVANNGEIGSISLLGSDMGLASMIQTQYLKSLKMDGSMLGDGVDGATIDVAHRLDKVQIAGDVEDGASIDAGGAGNVSVGGDMLGALMLGYYTNGATVSVGNDLGGMLTIDGDAKLTVQRDVLAGAEVLIGCNLKNLTIGGTGSGSIVVDGSGQTFRVGALNGAVITLGYDLKSLDVQNNVVNSLIQVGASAGEDGQFATGDFGETGRMGEWSTFNVRGAMTNSIAAAGGNFGKANISGGMTNSSISSGFVLGGDEIADVMSGAAPLSIAGNVNVARGGANRMLLRGDFQSATVGGVGLVNSDLTAGVDPGDDGEFGVGVGANADNVTNSLTGGNSSFGSINTTLDGNSTILADGGLGRSNLVGAGVDGDVTYAVADLIGAIVDPVANAITVNIRGNGTVTMYDDDNGADGVINTVVISGADSRTNIELVGGGINIGRIITEDDVELGNLTFDGDVVGVAGAGPDLWLDGAVKTFEVVGLGDDDLDSANLWTGQIGGDVNTLSVQTQRNAARLVIGGNVRSFGVDASEGDPLLRDSGTAVPASVTTLSFESDGTLWTFDPSTGLVQVGGGSTDVTTAYNGNVLSLIAMDFDGADELYAIAQLNNMSPTVKVGSIAGAAINLHTLAASSSGLVVAIDSSGAQDVLVSIDPETGAASPLGTLRVGIANFTFDGADFQALAFNSSGTLYGIVQDRDGTGPGTDGPALVKIQTSDSDNDGYLKVSSPLSDLSPGLVINGELSTEFTAMALTSGGTVYAINRVAGQDHLVTIDSATGDLTDLGVVQVDGADTAIAGMGFDSSGNLVAYDRAIGAGLIGIDTATPGDSELITTSDVIDPTLDAFVIARGGSYQSYGYDTDDVVGGMLYTNAGTISTLGIVDTATGEFIQLRGLSQGDPADGTALDSTPLAMSIDGAGDVVVLTADSRLLRYDAVTGELLEEVGAVTDANTGEALNLVSLDYDDAAGELIGLDARFGRLVTIDVTDATAQPRMERGAVDAMDLNGLAYDPITDAFYTFDDATNDLMVFRGTQQADLGGIVANSIDRLTVGDGFGGRIVTTGNTISSVTLEGDFAGRLVSSGDIKRLTQRTGDFTGSVVATGNIGSASLSGNMLNGSLMSAGLDLGRFSMGGSLAGVISALMSSSLSVTGAGETTANIEIFGTAKSVSFGGAFDGQANIGQAGKLTIGGLLNANADVVINDEVGNVAIKGGTAGGSWLLADGYVGSLTVGGVHSGGIGFRRGLGSAKFGDLLGSLTVIGEHTSRLQVGGDTMDSVISLGTWLGADGIYNTADDVITGGSLGTGMFSGTFRDSALVAGVLPNISFGPGVPTDLRAYTGNSSTGDVELADSAEAGGVLVSGVGNLTFRGTIHSTSPATGRRAVLATADGVDRIKFSSGGAMLLQRQYNDSFGAPTVVQTLIVNDSTAQIIFSEEMNSASLNLSFDADDDGSVTGTADVFGGVTVYDSAGSVLNDVLLSYSTMLADDGSVLGVLTLTNVTGFGDSLITVALSADLPDPVTGELAEPAIYDRSGLRSALRDVNQDGTYGEDEDQAGTILDGESNRLEGGNRTVVLSFGDGPGAFVDAEADATIPLIVDGGPTSVAGILDTTSDVDIYYFSADQYDFFSAEYQGAADALMALFLLDDQGTPDPADDYYELVARYESTTERISGVYRNVLLYQAIELPATGKYFLAIASDFSAGAYDLELRLASSDDLLDSIDDGMFLLPEDEVIAYVSNTQGENNNELGANDPKQLVYLDFDGGTTNAYSDSWGFEVNVGGLDLSEIDETLTGMESTIINGDAEVVGIIENIMDIFEDTPVNHPLGTLSVNFFDPTDPGDWAAYQAATEGLWFTTVDPAVAQGLDPDEDFTTIFIGTVSDGPFGGGALGLASTVDLANMSKGDNALVFAQNVAGFSIHPDVVGRLNEYSLGLANLAAHELGHTLGLNHQPTDRQNDSWELLPDDVDNMGAIETNLGNGLMAYVPNSDLITEYMWLGTGLTNTEFPVGHNDTLENLLRWLS